MGIESSVLIVGGGPVGLTLAIDLAWRGIDVTVVELRAAGEPPNVKCNQVSARSMEVYRRLGIAKKLREGGLPGSLPHGRTEQKKRRVNHRHGPLPVLRRLHGRMPHESNPFHDRLPYGRPHTRGIVHQ